MKTEQTIERWSIQIVKDLIHHDMSILCHYTAMMERSMTQADHDMKGGKGYI